MAEIQVKQLSQQERCVLKIPDAPAVRDGWSVWGCPASTFDWCYDETEEAYLYRGKVTVRTQEGAVDIKAGDFVVFPKGLACTWLVQEEVKKVYRFK